MKGAGAARCVSRFGTLRVAVALAVLVTGTAACATAPLPRAGAGTPVSALRFTVGQDTFAFPNEIRSRNRGRDDLYANYCFVLARGVRQFHEFARFDPALPRVSREEYLERVGRVAARSPWQPAVPPDNRVVIPGYRNLFEFSRDQAEVVKEGLGGPWWTWIHWTNWRVVLPVGGAHQEGVAAEIAAELDQGRLVQLLVTNLPTIELNHTVVAYAYRATESRVEFTVYDPNDPTAPGTLTFERTPQHFWATRIYDTRQGKIRAFRMYHSPLL
jgi:hypothetical protein